VRVIAALKFGFISIVWFILAFMVLMMINDGPAEYGDVSHAPEYAGWVGQRCTVLKGLVAHGVTFHPGPNEVTDVVHISPRRIGGPEITFERPIHRGTDMLITGVERCTTCVMFAIGRIQYAVRIIPNLPELAPYPIHAIPDALKPDQVHCVKDGSAAP
jgi:hypothetical protein